MKSITRITISIILVIMIIVSNEGPLVDIIPVEADVHSSQIDIIGPAGSGQFGKSVTVLPNGNFVVTDPSFDSESASNVGAAYLFNGQTRTMISSLTGATAGNEVGSGGVVVLENGNYLVLSPYWDNGAVTNTGAVTWGDEFLGIAGVVSASNSLVGTSGNDQVGSKGIAKLVNGNYLVRSPVWDNGTVVGAGAVTWGDGTAGISGEITAANSLVGSTADDSIGYWGIGSLTNGNYFVLNPDWDNGSEVNAGAVTWGDGLVGVRGEISASNSLVGSTTDDQIGIYGTQRVGNGNFVIRSPFWDNGSVVDAGAATWVNGSTGITGEVSASNSLVGTTLDDKVGYNIDVLKNGNYVVLSHHWDNGDITEAGAATWADGTTGISGEVSADNSLVGSSNGDQIGIGGTAKLDDGNYVLCNLYWDNGAIQDAGAVTWADGTTGITGEINVSNSLVGDHDNDLICHYPGITILTNGNYIVSSPTWNNGTGAVTWGNGAGGTTGVVSVDNSLVGDSVGDEVGLKELVVLNNGNYVVRSPNWDLGAITDAGAVTWGDGAHGTTGVVGESNSLIGSSDGDQIGYNTIPLTNGNYVVGSSYWNNGAVVDAGAATWGNGATGSAGVVSEVNSLVGSTYEDFVGRGAVHALNNGNYVVSSFEWNNGSVDRVGAVTWADGTTGVSGLVSSSNSLVGSSAADIVGVVKVLANENCIIMSEYWDTDTIQNAGAITWIDGSTGITGMIDSSNSLIGAVPDDFNGYWVQPLDNGDFVIKIPLWDNGSVVNAGALTWGSGSSGVTGSILPENSVQGTTMNGGNYMVYDYDYAHYRLIVGRPADNIVTIFLPYNLSFGYNFPIVSQGAP